MTKKDQKNVDIQTATAALPANLAEVALIDAATCAATGSMSVSWWHAEVAAGRAPAPVIRKPRCTRWSASSVRAFWQAFAASASDDQETGAKLIERNTRASRAASAKRAQLTAGGGAGSGT